MEWVRRYLPCEIAGTIGELGGAAVAYLLTGSMAAAAIAATIGASAGYYATAYINAVRWSYREQVDRGVAMRTRSPICSRYAAWPSSSVPPR